MVPSVGMVLSGVQSRSITENRMLAPPPGWPHSPAQWRAMPRAVDAYLADHFAFRRLLTTAADRLHWQLGGQITGGTVVRGREGRLFLRDNLLDVTGGVVNLKAVADYSGFVSDMNARLAARSIPMVFSMAPSPAAIYAEALPDWVPRGEPSAYDLILARTRTCGVKTVDLRPPLLAAKPSGSIYYHRDTHWTPKGAWIAYNALTTALGRPDWRIPHDRLAWLRTPEQSQDLARLAGVTDLGDEMMDAPALAKRTESLNAKPIDGIEDHGPRAGFIDETGRPGPTVLFIGDSYSADFMPPYFANSVGRFAWIHQQWCGFDWRVFDAVKPDLVIVMPVDRWASCNKGNRPDNMGR
jgi:hypothetical protein